MKLVAVTGATGFAGRAVCARLQKEGHNVRSIVRGETADLAVSRITDELFGAYEIGPRTVWDAVLDRVDVVVHLAAHVHQTSSFDEDYEKINVAGTKTLAVAAASAGVRRFIFVSSIGVNGRQSGDCPFSEKDRPNPVGPYAVSKWRAEQVLQEVAARTGMDLVILRPPLMYGPGAKANCLALVRLVDDIAVLPFGSVKSRRTLLYVENFADVVAQCIERLEAAGQTFILGDSEQISLTELMAQIAVHLGKRRYLMPCPVGLLRMIGYLTGRIDAMTKLLAPLEVNTTHIREVMNWTPPYALDEGLKKMCEWYMTTRRSKVRESS